MTIVLDKVPREEEECARKMTVSSRVQRIECGVARPVRTPCVKTLRVGCLSACVIQSCFLANTLVIAEARAEQPKSSHPASEQQVEIVIQADPLEAETSRMTRTEARSLPGAFGDPLRALEALPGVTPIVSGLPYFFVRGVPPANVGFFIDGVDVPLLYHAFFGPSVLQPASIESVELHAGAPPARYGRFAGPVVATELRRPRGALSGEASLRVIDAGALVETPFAAGRGNAMIGGRYSYAGLILSLLTDTRLSYWDYQSLISYKLGTRDEISLFAFGASDYIKADSLELDRETGAETRFHRVDMRWDSTPNSRTRTRVGVTLGSDHTSGDRQFLTDRSLRVRTELSHHASDNLLIEFGADARLDDFDLHSEPTRGNYLDLIELFPKRTDGTFGTYAEVTWHPVPELRVAPGLRADLYTAHGPDAVGIDPRISTEVRLSPAVSVEHSIGLMHQRPNFVPQVPAAQVGSLEDGLQTAWIQSSGVRVKLPLTLTLQASVFRTAVFDAVDPIGGARDFDIDRSTIEERRTISAQGLELKLARSLTRDVGGFIAYTLSRSEWSSDRVESVSGFDRTHVVQTALTYRFGRGISAGVRGVFYTGIPARIIGGSETRFSSERRSAPFLRLDTRAEKRWKLGKNAYIAAVVEVLNATGSGEVLKLECGATCRTTKTSPVILPSVGVEAGF